MKNEFLSLEDVKDFYDEISLTDAVEGIKLIRAYLLTVISESEVETLILALEKDDFDAVIEAMHHADEDGITVYDRIDLDDVEEDLHEKLPSNDVELLLEVIEIYNALEDNNYSGCELGNMAFIHADHFQQYIKDGEIEGGHVASHLIDHVDWESYADLARIDYGSVEIDAINFLKSSSAEFYYRK